MGDCSQRSNHTCAVGTVQAEHAEIPAKERRESFQIGIKGCTDPLRASRVEGVRGQWQLTVSP
jgi:hypothetical protein